MQLSRIMVPLDGSVFAERALPLALAAAEPGTEVCLVSVLEPPFPDLFIQDVDELGGVFPASEAYLEAALETREAGLRGYLDTVAGRVAERHDGEPRTELLDGVPVDALNDHVRRIEPDLVVMTTHGRSGLSRAWLGSVADGLIRHCVKPVLLARPGDDGAVDLDQTVELERVLVPLDGSGLSESILPDVTRFCRSTGAACTLLSVVVPPLEPGSTYVPQTPAMTRELLEEARERALGYLESAAGRLSDEGVDVSTETVVHPVAASAILEAADRTGADVIAMATHGRTGFRRLILGSVGDKVLRGAGVPVMLRRPEKG